MAEVNVIEDNKYERSVSMIKTQGILSIVFGAIGVLFALIMLLMFAAALSTSYSDEEITGYFALFIMTVLFWLLPHVYLVVSGILLVRLPSAAVVRVLTIINIVIGAFWNWVLLVFSIITIIQVGDYENGQKKLQKTHR